MRRALIGWRAFEPRTLIHQYSRFDVVVFTRFQIEKASQKAGYSGPVEFLI